MSRLEEYQRRLEQHRSDFVAACEDVLRAPIPDCADYGGLNYQDDGSRLIPVSLTWITFENRHTNPRVCPFSRFEGISWIWTDDDLDNCVHEDAEDHFFEWVSRCWIEAGGRKFSPLFVLYDHGSMDTYDLNTLEELSIEDIKNRIGANDQAESRH